MGCYAQKMSTRSNSFVESLRVALVEDETVLREELVFQLQHRGFQVVGFADATGLYRHLATQPVGAVTAVVLDIGLPGENGLSIGALLRAHNPQLGIVYLTARSLREDKLAGWAAGADGYLVKPVDLDELDLLLRRLIQRQWAPPSATPQEEALMAIPASDVAWKLNSPKALLIAPNGARLQLTLTELQLLGELVAKRGNPCKPAELARAMGLQPDEWDRHRLEVIVSRLRVKVERETGFDAPIRTVRGVGYAWAADQVD